MNWHGAITYGSDKPKMSCLVQTSEFHIPDITGIAVLEWLASFEASIEMPMEAVWNLAPPHAPPMGEVSPRLQFHVVDLRYTAQLALPHRDDLEAPIGLFKLWLATNNIVFYDGDTVLFRAAQMPYAFFFTVQQAYNGAAEVVCKVQNRHSSIWLEFGDFSYRWGTRDDNLVKRVSELTKRMSLLNGLPGAEKINVVAMALTTERGEVFRHHVGLEYGELLVNAQAAVTIGTAPDTSGAPCFVSISVGYVPQLLRFNYDNFNAQEVTDFIYGLVMPHNTLRARYRSAVTYQQKYSLDMPMQRLIPQLNAPGWIMSFSPHRDRVFCAGPRKYLNAVRQHMQMGGGDDIHFNQTALVTAPHLIWAAPPSLWEEMVPDIINWCLTMHVLLPVAELMCTLTLLMPGMELVRESVVRTKCTAVMASIARVLANRLAEVPNESIGARLKRRRRMK